jgi:alpha-tubulin suppressor-like RCC1 family protein
LGTLARGDSLTADELTHQRRSMMSPSFPPSRRTLPLLGSLVVLLACGEGAGSPSDPAPVRLSFTTSPIAGTWGDLLADQPIVAAVDEEGNVVDTVTRSVTLKLIDGGSAQLAGATTVAAAGGTAAFTGLAVDRPAANVRLVASAAGLAPDTTPPFTIGGPGPDHLAFVNPPAGGSGGTPFTTPPVIEVRTAAGQVVPWFSGEVTLARAAGGPGGTLSGTLTRQVFQGAVIFPGLAFDSAGAGYALVASASGVASDTSEAFAVAVGHVAAAKSAFLPDLPSFLPDDTVGFTLVARDAGGNIVIGAAPLLTAGQAFGTPVGEAHGGFQEVGGGTYRVFLTTAVAGTMAWRVYHDGRPGPTSSNVAIVGVSSVATGDSHTCATLTTGALYCWGESDDGRLGRGEEGDRLGPARVGSEVGWSGPSVGWKHSCATRSSAVWCWGDNSWGQLITGDDAPRATPTLVPGTGAGWLIATGLGRATGPLTRDGGFNTCLRDWTQWTWCVGDNRSGQIGDETQGSMAAAESMIQVSGGRRYDAVVVGAEMVCAQDFSDATWCWGGNSVHQLGLGTGAGNDNCPDGNGPCRVSPALVVDGRFLGRSLDAGVDFTCGLRSGGVPYCWGQIEFAGGGSVLNPVPASLPVSGLSRITVGAGSICGLYANGRVGCWGSNDAGQLGDGSVGDRTSQFGEIAGGRTYLSVDVGGKHACAIEAVNRRLWCWGANDSGQLGDESQVARNVPVQVRFPI